MATIIDTTYFYEELSIAQLDQAAVAGSVQRYIAKHEPDLLKALLGYALYQDFVANQGAPKYQDLLNGKEYTNSRDLVVTWRGLKEEVAAPVAGPPAVAGIYRSLIAQYVYYQYTYYNATVTTGTGEKRLRTENAVDASPDLKLVKAWNQMVDWNCELVTFLWENRTTYTQFEAHFTRNRSAFKHLLTPINRFGI